MLRFPLKMWNLMRNLFNLYSEYDGKGVPFKSGDILLNKLRLYLLKYFYLIMMVSMGEMIVIRVNENVSNKYYFYLLFNQGLIDLLDSQSTGIKVQGCPLKLLWGVIYPTHLKMNKPKSLNTLMNKPKRLIPLLKKKLSELNS